MHNPLTSEYEAELAHKEALKMATTKLEKLAEPVEARMRFATRTAKIENPFLQDIIAGKHKVVLPENRTISYMKEPDFTKNVDTFTLAELLKVEALAIEEVVTGVDVQNQKIVPRPDLPTQHLLRLEKLPNTVFRINTMQKDGGGSRPEDLEVISLDLLEVQHS